LQLKTPEGCITTESVQIKAKWLETQVKKHETWCEGATGGSIEVLPIVYTAPLRFKWEDGLPWIKQTNLSMGTYKIQVSDRFCIDTLEVTISNEPIPQMSEIKSGTTTWVTQNSGRPISILRTQDSIYWTSSVAFSATRIEKWDKNKTLIAEKRLENLAFMRLLVMPNDEIIGLSFYNSYGGFSASLQRIDDDMNATPFYVFDSKDIVRDFKVGKDGNLYVLYEKPKLLPNNQPDYNDYDVWVAQFSPFLTFNWSKQYGGTKNEKAVGLDTLQGKIVVLANTYSQDMDLINLGVKNQDIWLFWLNTDGEITQQKTLSGNYDEQAYNFKTGSLGIILALQSNSKETWFAPTAVINNEFSALVMLDKQGNPLWHNSFHKVWYQPFPTFYEKTDSKWDIFGYADCSPCRYDANGKYIGQGEGTFSPSGIEEANGYTFLNTKQVIYSGGGGHCCPTSVNQSRLITYKSTALPPILTLTPDTTLCQGQNLQITATTNAPNTILTYDTTHAIIIIDAPQLLTFTASDGFYCTKTDNVLIDFCPLSKVLKDSTACVPIKLIAGNEDFGYKWSTGSESNSITADTTGWYFVTITAFSGANIVDSAFITILQNDLQTTATIDEIECNNQTGSIDLTTTGTGGIFKYKWNTGSEDPFLHNITGNVYNVTITDERNCMISANFNLVNPQIVNANFMTTLGTCSYSENGSIGLQTISGGTAPYTYKWNTGDTSKVLQNVIHGNYKVTITDANGCTVEKTKNLPQTPKMYTGTSILQPGTNGNPFGKIQLQVYNGVAPLVYAWSNGGTSNTQLNLTGGLYSWTVTDSRGCVLVDSVFLGNVAIKNPLEESKNSITLFPNPSNGKVFLIAKEAPNEAILIEIYNSQGILVQRIDGVLLKKEMPTMLDFESLASGFYILKWRNKEGINGEIPFVLMD
jgi:Secretion system C-terminal sorting domain/SprB repeat